MPSPFGKMKKTPEQNALCFLLCVDAYIDESRGLPYDRYGKKRFPKYMKRMNDIMNGEYKKCINSLENLTKIAEEFGRHYLIVNKMILEINQFSLEDK